MSSSSGIIYEMLPEIQTLKSMIFVNSKLENPACVSVQSNQGLCCSHILGTMFRESTHTKSGFWLDCTDSVPRPGDQS